MTDEREWADRHIVQPVLDGQLPIKHFLESELGRGRGHGWLAEELLHEGLHRLGLDVRPNVSLFGDYHRRNYSPYTEHTYKGGFEIDALAKHRFDGFLHRYAVECKDYHWDGENSTVWASDVLELIAKATISHSHPVLFRTCELTDRAARLVKIAGVADIHISDLVWDVSDKRRSSEFRTLQKFIPPTDRARRGRASPHWFANDWWVDNHCMRPDYYQRILSNREDV